MLRVTGLVAASEKSLLGRQAFELNPARFDHRVSMGLLELHPGPVGVAIEDRAHVTISEACLELFRRERFPLVWPD